MLSICLSTFTLIIFIIVCFTLFRTNYLLIKIIFVIVYLVFIISFLYTVLINPGIPRKQYYIEYFKNKNLGSKDNWQRCSKCNILIPKNFKVTHCQKCQVCVREQDHHCPWTGKCIGKYNLISFYIFVNSLFAYIFAIFITLFGYIFIIINKKKNSQ